MHFAQITLVKDRNSPPDPAAAKGRLVATAINAVDGKLLSIGAKVSQCIHSSLAVPMTNQLIVPVF